MIASNAILGIRILRFTYLDKCPTGYGILHKIGLSEGFRIDSVDETARIQAVASNAKDYARQQGEKMNAKPVDLTRVLSQQEIAQVIADLKKKGRRSLNQRQNLIVFRLSACCGLRVSEIAGLTMANVITETVRPHIYVPKQIAKRNKARKIPLWWDQSTLDDLRAWKAERTGQGAKAGSSFIASLQGKTTGEPLTTRAIQYRWEHAIKILGSERAAMLSIHCGRHSFCSHALNGGRGLIEVRDAAGHADIGTTSIYLHAVEQDNGTVGNLFEF